MNNKYAPLIIFFFFLTARCAHLSYSISRRLVKAEIALWKWNAHAIAATMAIQNVSQYISHKRLCRHCSRCCRIDNDVNTMVEIKIYEKGLSIKESAASPGINPDRPNEVYDSTTLPPRIVANVSPRVSESRYILYKVQSRSGKWIKETRIKVILTEHVIE